MPVVQCAVVGSGVSGLSAALLLARQGHAVTVLEAGPHPAPLLQGFSRAGLHFDTGFHYGGGLQQGGILRQWLQTLGVWQHLHLCSTAHEDIFCFSGEVEKRLPAGQDAVLDAVEAQFPDQRAHMRQLLAECQTVLDHSPYTNPARTENAVSWRGQSHSLAQKLAQWNFPPHLQSLLSARCLLYGVPPHLAAWDDYALVAGPYFQSCNSWMGGGAALVRAFEKELAQLDIHVRCRATVTQLDVGADPKTLRGVWLADGQHIPCEQCYFTGHPGQLQQLLPPGMVRPAWFTRIREMPETHSALMLFAETSALPAGFSCYLLPPLSEPLLSPFPLSPESHISSFPSLYLACGHPEPGTTAQAEGRVPLMVLALMRPEDLPATSPNSGPEYARFKAQATAQLTALTEERCPALRGHWRILETATPQTMRRWIYGGSGSLYGFQHDTESLPLLPVTRVPGLFLAGQNILLPGVLGGIVSAALAVGFAHGHDAALKEFRKCAGTA